MSEEFRCGLITALGGFAAKLTNKPKSTCDVDFGLRYIWVG